MEDNEKVLLAVVAVVIIGFGLGANVLTPEGVRAIPQFENLFYTTPAGW